MKLRSGRVIERGNEREIENQFETLPNQSESEIENQFKSEIENQSESEIENQFETQLPNQSESEIENQFETQLPNQSETRNQIPFENQSAKPTEKLSHLLELINVGMEPLFEIIGQELSLLPGKVNNVDLAPETVNELIYQHVTN